MKIPYILGIFLKVVYNNAGKMGGAVDKTAETQDINNLTGYPIGNIMIIV